MKAKKIRQLLKSRGIDIKQTIYDDFIQGNGNTTKILNFNCGRAIYKKEKNK